MAAPADLVAAHLPLVEAIAASLIRSGHGHWGHRDDMTAWGYLGLCQAAASYREVHGPNFVAYAWHRIQGSILDGLRRDAGVTMSRRPGREALVVADLEQDVQPDESGHDVAALREAIAALPPKERALVEAVDLEGRRLEEASRAMGMTKGWGSKLRARGLEALRVSLEGERAS